MLHRQPLRQPPSILPAPGHGPCLPQGPAAGVQHACHQPKERLPSSFRTIANSGLETPEEKQNHSTSFLVALPAPRCLGFPPGEQDRRTGAKNDKHFLIPLSQQFPKQTSLHCSQKFLSYLGLRGKRKGQKEERDTLQKCIFKDEESYIFPSPVRFTPRFIHFQ